MPHNTTDYREAISPYYYWLMLTPIAISHAQQFIHEESDNLDNYLVRHLNYFSQLNVVGGGNFMYISKALEFGMNYTCIEPYMDMYIYDSTKTYINYINNYSKSKVNFIAKSLDQLNLSDLDQIGKKVYLFMFNVASYILNPESCIDKLKQKGDVFIISCWNIKNKESLDLRKSYFDFLNTHGGMNIQYDDKSIMLDLDKFESSIKDKFSDIRITRVTKNITDTLILEF